MATLTQVIELLQQTLKPGLYPDYCPNGLQVEGKAEVRRLVTGVTASQALLDEAVRRQADAVLVHHGYFWKGEDPCVVGMKQRRLKTLLSNDMSLLAYHLPLDGHESLGNNAQLARRLGLPLSEPLYPENPRQVGNIAMLEQPMRIDELVTRLARILERQPLHIAGGPELVRRIGFCTGGAQGFIEQAALMQCDAYISGEISEQTVHVAREQGIHYFAAGHHATERYGVEAVGEFLAAALGIEHEFVDIPSPA
ncbi:MAG TPA: Nif3-like dinuclear metal center hexameric protein [Fluviicoccus sp.]|nr:Nif3-like dinuclear metal center hexameric protein [Fluviicoccus sp.]